MPQPLTALMVDSIYSSCIKGSISSKTYRAATSGVEATAAADPLASAAALCVQTISPSWLRTSNLDEPMLKSRLILRESMRW